MSFYRRHHTLREIYYQARLLDEQELSSARDMRNCLNCQESLPLSADKRLPRSLLFKFCRPFS